METLIDVLVFIIFGFAGMGVMALYRGRAINKENNEVLEKVNKIDKKNEDISKKIENNLNETNKKIEELEREKNVKKTIEEIADWFNNRKPDNK